MTPKNNLLIGITIAVIVLISFNLELNPVEFAEGIPNIIIILEEVKDVDFDLIERALYEMLVTLQMAFVSTVAGVAIAIPLSLLAARNLNSRWVYVPLRIILSAVRTLPSILWALLMVVIVGPGILAGVIALTLYTVGFIAKLQYEAIEAVDSDPIDAVSSIGVSKSQLVRYVILPESAPHLWSQILYMFEYNVRQGSILGIVGAGGIGFLLQTQLSWFYYGNVVVLLLIIFATVLAVDGISLKIRDRFIVKSQHGAEVKT